MVGVVGVAGDNTASKGAKGSKDKRGSGCLCLCFCPCFCPCFCLGSRPHDAVGFLGAAPVARWGSGQGQGHRARTLSPILIYNLVTMVEGRIGFYANTAGNIHLEAEVGKKREEKVVEGKLNS